MKNRIKVTIAIVSGLAVIALIIGLVSCNKKASPDISSSTANEEETEISSDASSEVITSGSSEEATPTSSFSRANTETSEESTETTKNIEVAESTQQTSQTTRSSEPVRVNSDQTQPKATATPTPKPTKAPTSAPTNAPKPTSTPKPTATPKPIATPTPEPTEAPEPTKAPTSTPKPTPTPKPVNDPKYTKCIADVEYWAGNDNCYHGIVYGVPCKRNKSGKWVITNEGEQMVWDAIEAEHPDYGGYTDKIVSGSQRNFS